MKPFSPGREMVCLTVLLAGCASPPEPVAVNWGRAPTTLNSTLPQWQENNNVVRSPDAGGEWSKVLRNFQGASGRHTPDVYYALAHASRIVVASNNGAAWFNTKAWLQAHGATVPIGFNPKTDYLSCATVDVYLSRLENNTARGNEDFAPTKKSSLVKADNGLAGKTDKTTSKNTEENPSAAQITSKPEVIVKKPPPLPRPVWRAEAGSTLKATLFRWSAAQTCPEGGSWRVIWETAVNYPIDAPLRFEGDFNAALNGLFGLYQQAQKPLYAVTNRTQCLIKVTDKG